MRFLPNALSVCVQTLFPFFCHLFPFCRMSLPLYCEAKNPPPEAVRQRRGTKL